MENNIESIEDQALSQADKVWKKSWTAYIHLLFIFLLFFLLPVPIAFAIHWIAGVVVAIIAVGYIAYRALYINSYRLYYDDSGIWIYSGVFPWQKGIHGVKWRDLSEAGYFQGMWSWLFKSYRIVIGHRFTKTSEIHIDHIAHGEKVVVEINQLHEELVTNEQIK